VNPSTALATVLVDELARLGVREVVLCPGSRSAPIAYAVHAAANGTNGRADHVGGGSGVARPRLHVRVDERSAGFLALGLAKLTRRPAVVVTTSGTAVANLHPAVLEAHHGLVPLIVLSADRPAELRGTGANQTTTQPGIFGGALRWSSDVPAPERRPGQQARAVAAATGTMGGTPGPVHVNVGLREPLVPTTGDWPEPLDGRPDGRPWVDLRASFDEPHRGVDGAGGPGVVGGGGRGRPARDGDRTLVVVGDLPSPDLRGAALRWAGRRGWPVVAEPFGDHPRASVPAEHPVEDGVLPHGPLVLTVGEWLDAHAPERVITVGRITLARPVAALLRRPGLRIEHVSAVPEWTDPSHVVSAVHPVSVLREDSGDAGTDGDVVTDRDAMTDGEVATNGGVTTDGHGQWDQQPAEGATAAWSREWAEAGEAIARAVVARPPAWPSGLAVAAVVARTLPEGSTLFVGSSNTARDLDLGVGRWSSGVRVVGNRGLSGIDGSVSTAVGIALAAQRADPGTERTSATRCCAVLGDLTFLHDANGLLIGPTEPRPDLTVVVTNDDGGGIFTLLEPGEPDEPRRADAFERLFGTPTGADIGAVCRAHGIPHEVAATPEALAAALTAPPDGIRVVEVPVERSGHREAHAELRATAAAALSG
jgi:2-succinyl-5-enolpyruvyl-6-hydroxy-3-cyclohexene-1-carboxylate synthase